MDKILPLPFILCIVAKFQTGTYLESVGLSTLLYHLWSQHISVIYKFFILSAVEFRRSLHSRLGLPYDRPLLRIANALDFSKLKNSGIVSQQKGSSRISIESLYKG